jgi:hypothetical protein
MLCHSDRNERTGTAKRTDGSGGKVAAAADALRELKQFVANIMDDEQGTAPFARRSRVKRARRAHREVTRIEHMIFENKVALNHVAVFATAMAMR